MGNSTGPLVVAIIFTVLCLYALIAFVGVKMGDLNDRVQALEEAYFAEVIR